MKGADGDGLKRVKSMKAKAVLEINCGDGKTAIHTKDALSHEGNLGKRSRAGLETEGPRLIINIEADDVVALRAAVNSFMRGIQLIEDAEGKVFSKRK